MDKLHYYVCQTDELLAEYIKIAEVDSAHILELDKTMENIMFMTRTINTRMNQIMRRTTRMMYRIFIQVMS
jgi:hypothetical protein